MKRFNSKPLVGVMKCGFNLAAILFVLLNLVGCASPSGVVKNDSPVLISKLVSMDFIFVESTSSLGDLETEKHLLGDLIVSGLREKQSSQRERE
jgi:hypothetical protein